MRAPRLTLLALALGLVLPSCSRDPAPEAVRREPSAASGSPARTRKLRLVPAPPGPMDVATIMRAEAASAPGPVLVYVGAPWCEPCTYFHAAAERGELDADFGDLTLVEFNRDSDKARLDDAGYASDYIPLFAVPGPDGRASGRSIEGSIKGPGAVPQIRPRLKALIGR